MRPLPLVLLLVAGISGCTDATRSKSVATPEERTSVVVDRDNTGVNERDRAPDAKTPIDQNENKSDIDITAGIRKRVVDTDMSVNAHNVKIITQDGQVTLRGPVKSAAEKQQIEKIAHDVAGVKKVSSLLEIESNP